MSTTTPSPQGSSPHPSRYESIQAILNRAAGNSPADYQGAGRFWNLPLNEFLKFQLYGISMIAPLGNSDGSGKGHDLKVPIPGVADYGYCGALSETSLSSVAKPSCCSIEGDSEVSPLVKSPGRGARSGLILGLKGSYPFNAPAGQFPPLPWGGSRVSSSDIRIIEEWIDDGCPAEDSDNAKTEISRSRYAWGEQAHALSRRTTNSIQADRGGLKQRKNIEFLSKEELCQWQFVHNEMIQLNQWPLDKRNWNYWGQFHGNECQHGWEQFLLWHRMYLYEFEQRCQDILPNVTIPYWDWPMDQYLNGNLPSSEAMKKRFPPSIKASIPEMYTSGVIPTPYQCYLNEKAANVLIQQHGINSNIRDLVGYRYNSGIEFFWAVGQLIGEEVLATIKPALKRLLIEVNPLWYPYRYPAMFWNMDAKFKDGEPAMQDVFHHHYPRKEDVEALLQIESWLDFVGGPSYDQSFGALDMDPHNTGHIWSGGFNPIGSQDPQPSNFVRPYDEGFYEYEAPTGDMLNNLTAGYDPIFWIHHSNVDRLFDQWQDRHPGQQPFEPNAPLAGLSYNTRDALKRAALGYEYAKSSYHFETDPSVEFARLRTEKTSIHPAVLSQHRKAELRLHQVIQPNLSYGIRVFINQAEANASTPIENNPHFAGYVAFFGHGKCIGGPGHCAPPPEDRRSFDRRMLHHNTPRNFKIDVTSCVQGLAKNNAQDLEITLVVIGPKPNQNPTLLRLQGISLNFLD